MSALSRTRHSLSVFLARDNVNGAANVYDRTYNISVLRVASVRINFRERKSTGNALQRGIANNFGVYRITVDTFRVFNHNKGLIPVNRARPTFAVDREPVSIV